MGIWWRSGSGGGGKWVYIWPMWVTMILHVLAILIFTRGFLLTRTELPYYSNCSDISESPCFSYTTPSSSSPNHSQSGTNSSDRACWTKPIVNRLVIIVLDALRFDFVAPSTFFKEPKPWMDHLQVLQKMASTNGSSARIFKAIADPPTTSLQRLKGLTTGGLPTFIDVGNSFGAPAILVQNGKRVVMMGDDTWMQLFPQHFEKSYPYPSFNVKDLHTVDNGCIDHLLPSLYEGDWDVLISHFLGVDHAGHIFGVDSTPMIEKLKQYNLILEKVIKALESQSGPGGLHENTFLVVMGDHGQTLNGDHGGGSAEEVETSMFAMTFKKPPSSIPSELDSSSCGLDLDGKNLCVSSIQQLDFAVTMSALLGIPFPLGSIGRVNPELYALGSGSWNLEGSQIENDQKQSELEKWMENYVNVLCVNSWQVKRYIDIYSASSVVGFSNEDLLHISSIYAQAEENWSNSTKILLLDRNRGNSTLMPVLKRQVDAYLNFIATVAELARSKWTEFDLRMMGIGISIMLISFIFQIIAIKWVDKQYSISVPSPGDSAIFSGSMFTYFVVAMRACSFLSNSYILEEGKVANFLLATTGVVKLRYSIMKGKMLLEGVMFLFLSTFCRFAIEVGLSKQSATSAFMKEFTSGILNIVSGLPLWMYITEVVPMLIMILLAYLLYKATARSSIEGLWKCVILGSILSYMLIAVHWASESNVLGLALPFEGFGRNYIPRIIYVVTLGQLFLLAFGQLFSGENPVDWNKSLVTKTVAMVSAWSSTAILLSGKQGPMVALASTIGAYCILRLDNIEEDAKNKTGGSLRISPFPVMQWSLLAVCLFFSTGHWCAFDGLRYGAAFIGFDEFILVRQAILLTIDTFGFSIIIPTFGLPFLALYRYFSCRDNRGKNLLFMQLSQAYTMYGLITASTVTFTIICVTIQRRHLMVWGLFAPKFVFDAVGLILTDIFICLASLYYFG
ncbi:GPI ethanolamine phosphate transferase 3 [Quillaja saponaria]|uniref:GPI ethanolamine phosphate transferase 3 n=1 Tax=Quillaja saponaria TaxID=32244 RepID=A0AAD7QFS3_QUISA|nr:GPI ethanolamine phosphate transferase 3 [Quillaja saponaria]